VRVPLFAGACGSFELSDVWDVLSAFARSPVAVFGFLTIFVGSPKSDGDCIDDEIFAGLSLTLRLNGASSGSSSSSVLGALVSIGARVFTPGTKFALGFELLGKDGVDSIAGAGVGTVASCGGARLPKVGVDPPNVGAAAGFNPDVPENVPEFVSEAPKLE